MSDVFLSAPDKEPRPDGYRYKPVDGTTPEGAAVYARQQRAARLAQRMAANADNAALRRLLRKVVR